MKTEAPITYPISIQGRTLMAEQMAFIRQLLAEHPDWNRSLISRHICEAWDWRSAVGELKDMACRTMLLKLHRRGLIQLPPGKHDGRNSRRGLKPTPFALPTLPIQCELKQLRPIRLMRVVAGDDWADVFTGLLQQYHYLGQRTRVGENMRYLALDCQDRPVGCLLFGSAAWKADARDRWIGWDGPTRQRNLQRITNNTRFLIAPWVRVDHLASHLLALALARLSRDWQQRYGHPIELVETFVDSTRFSGTCYRAAGWQCVGQTTGRTRQDRNNCICEPPKLIYLRPLNPRWRQHLSGE